MAVDENIIRALYNEKEWLMAVVKANPYVFYFLFSCSAAFISSILYALY